MIGWHMIGMFNKRNVGSIMHTWAHTCCLYSKSHSQQKWYGQKQ